MKRFLVILLLLICVPAYARAPNEGGDSEGIIRSMDWVFNDIWEDGSNAIRIRISSDVVSTVSCDLVDAVVKGGTLDTLTTLTTITNAVSVDVSIPKSIITGQLTIDVAATGTPVVLTADVAAVTEIQVIPLVGNVGQVYIRNSASRPASTEGYRLTADVATVLRVDSTSDVYMDADVAGDGISWIGFVR